MNKEDLALETTMESIDKKPEGAANLEGEAAKTADPEAEADSPESDEGKPETDGADEGAQDGKPDDSLEIILSGEDEEQPPAADDKSSWYKLRKAKQEAEAKAEAAERKLRELQVRPDDGDPGAEPKPEDFLYDNDKYKEALFAWKDKTARFEQAKARKAEQAEAEARAAREREVAYATQKAALAPRVEGYAEAERLVASTLSETAQDVLMSVVGNTAKVVYVLGRRPEKLAALAKITNRDKFVAELVRLELSIMEKKRKGTPPPPEEVPRGGGASTRGGDAELEAAEARALKTGDRSEVRAIQRRRKAEQDARNAGRR